MTVDGKMATGEPVIGGNVGVRKDKVNTLDKYMEKGKQRKEKGNENGAAKASSGKNGKMTVNICDDENKQEMEDYWESVVKGPSSKIVTIKQEHAKNDNPYEVLDGKGEDQKSDYFKSEKHIKASDEDIQQYKRISTDNLMELEIANVDTMEIAELSEHVFQYMRCTNSELERRNIYLKDEKWLRNTLRTAIKKVQTKEFLQHVDRLANKVKTYDLDAENVDLSMGNLLKSIHVASQSSQEVETLDVRSELKKIRSVIQLIEAYVNNPLTMIPKEIFQLDNCSKDDIMKKDYFSIVMAIMYARARVGNTLEIGMEDLRNQAVELNRLLLKDKQTKDINQSPTKKSRTSQNVITPADENKQSDFDTSMSTNLDMQIENENMNQKEEQVHNEMSTDDTKNGVDENEFKDGPTDEAMLLASQNAEEKKKKHIEQSKLVKEGMEKKRSQLEQHMKKMREDKVKQAQNLNGMNIDYVTPKEEITGPTFDFPEGKKIVKHIVREKTTYYLHNKIHVEDKVHAHEIVKMVIRVLRKADPTIVLLPFKKETATMNATIDMEDQVPDDETELKKWIGIADRQPYKKFAFSIRVNLTEEPDVVKGRIFNWCKDRQHYFEFKQITSANIFFAGWLFRIHKQYHNREELRNWMVQGNETLKHDIHLAPARIFKSTGDDKDTKVITNGLRVEASFEKREAILQELYKLEWSEGPYKDALFIPYRENEVYTKEMQVQFIESHNQYLQSVEQRVFKMKGPQWQIDNLQTNEKTTFQKWLGATTSEGRKVIESVEVGDNDYVRLIYKKSHRQYIQHIMRHLHQTTKDTFGEEVTNKLFTKLHGVRNSRMHELEEAYTMKLKAALGGNPMDDQNDTKKVPPVQRRKQENKVSFRSDLDESYATIAKKNGKATPINNITTNENIKIDDLKEELLKEVKKEVDTKIDGLERKVEKKINSIKIEQDAKIENLATLVKDTHAKAEAAAVRRDEALTQKFEENNNTLIDKISALFQNTQNSQNKVNNGNPPIPTVENDSRAGGSQK